MTAPAGPGYPASDDDELWKQEADELRHKGLDAMRASAAKWHDSIAVLLGVFSVVAFVKGPDTFADQSAPVAVCAAVAVILAAVLAAIATLLAAFAAQGKPTAFRMLTGPALRHRAAADIETVARQVRWSRILAIGAALLILTGVSITWFAGILDKPAKHPARVVVMARDGTVTCINSSGPSVPEQLAGHGGAVNFVVVADCPDGSVKTTTTVTTGASAPTVGPG
jgi:hypothetical protein